MSALSPAQLNALRLSAAISVACERATQLPAELSIAQWALESSWGLHQPGNNCFGIKAYPGCFGVQLLQTSEMVNGQRLSVAEEFATFPTLGACFRKHADLLTRGRPYAAAWLEYLLHRDLGELVRQIGSIYSTDPEYGAKLLRIAAMPEVRGSLLAARSEI